MDVARTAGAVDCTRIKEESQQSMEEMISKERLKQSRHKHVLETVSERPLGSTDAVEEYSIALEKQARMVEACFAMIKHPLTAIGYLSPGTSLSAALSFFCDLEKSLYVTRERIKRA